MRWLVSASLLSVAFVVFVVVAAVTSGPAKSPDDYELHLPETAEEKAVAGLAVAYVRALQSARADAVCRYVAPPAATKLRCAARPRIPHDLYVGPAGTPGVENVGVRDD